MTAAPRELPEQALDVLGFWFLELTPEQWFSSSEALDAQITERFGSLHERAANGDLNDWSSAPRARLALIIVLDQFSRNIHRGTGKAFAWDDKAQELTVQAISLGEDENLGLDERQFLYMPLMHAEDRELQALAVEKYQSLADSAARVTDFAHTHRDIVDRFGRFPYRNPLLRRESTAEETAFIEDQGNPFS